MNESFNHNWRLIEIEAECEKLNHLLADSNSNRLLIFAISDFFEKLLQTNNKTILDAYISQFIKEYKNCLSTFDPFFISPISTEKMLETAKHIFRILDVNVDKDFITNQINRIEKKSGELNKVLMGNDSKELIGLYFPVLEQEILQSKESFGLLESLTVQIRKTKNETKFLVIPSELHLEQKIQKQIDDSWLNAINFLKKNRIKISEKYYEILIAFDLKEGTIIGNSLGVVLTISFIEELLKFYNSNLIVNSKDSIAITGGLDDLGKIISTSKEIIRIKTEIVFYSSIKTFCSPKVNEIDANERLFELKQQYPNRNLEIIGLTDLNDLLNRRNVVDVHKKNLIQIVATIILRKWKSILLAMILTIVFSFLFVLDFDDNPTAVYSDSIYLHITNKNGKLLKSIYHPTEKVIAYNIKALKYIIRFIDVDGDSKNEILYADPGLIDEHKSNFQSKILCLKNLNDTLWAYSFEDSVFSEREVLSTEYFVSVIDVIKERNMNELICSATNTTSFSNAVFLLDLKSGKRIPKTHWFSGHIMGGILLDFNNDGSKDLIMVGIDNGYEQAVLWGVELAQLDGYRFTIPSYIIKNKRQAELLFYIRIPKLDYENYMGFRSSGIDWGSLIYLSEESLMRFNTLSFQDKSMTERLPLMDYRFKFNLSDVNIYVGSSFRVLRDSLVVKGLLNKPFTDTKEYIEQQKDKILYWEDGKWIKRFGKEKK